MNPNSNEQAVTGAGARPVSAEQRLKELGIKLPAPPEPFGTYIWKRGAKRLTSRRSTSSLSRGSIWDRSTK
jgi:hypothetical protein